MSTLQRNPSISPQPRITLGAGLVALGVLISIVVSIIFIASARNHTTPNSTATHNHASSGYVPLIPYRGTGGYVPLIQYRGTGASHVFPIPGTGKMHGGVTPPAERSGNPTSPSHQTIGNTGHGAVP